MRVQHSQKKSKRIVPRTEKEARRNFGAAVARVGEERLCPRCGGLMISEVCYPDLAEDVTFEQWRCVNCAYTVDPVAQANRYAQKINRYM